MFFQSFDALGGFVTSRLQVRDAPLELMDLGGLTLDVLVLPFQLVCEIRALFFCLRGGGLELRTFRLDAFVVAALVFRPARQPAPPRGFDSPATPEILSTV